MSDFEGRQNNSQRLEIDSLKISSLIYPSVQDLSERMSLRNERGGYHHNESCVFNGLRWKLQSRWSLSVHSVHLNSQLTVKISDSLVIDDKLLI